MPMNLTPLKIPSRGIYYAYCVTYLHSYPSNRNFGCRNEVTLEPKNINVRKHARAHVDYASVHSDFGYHDKNE